MKKPGAKFETIAISEALRAAMKSAAEHDVNKTEPYATPIDPGAPASSGKPENRIQRQG